MKLEGWKLEYVDPKNNHNKYYKILIKDNNVIFNWGRIGAPGQLISRQCYEGDNGDDNAEALIFAEDQKQKKLDEGYEEAEYDPSDMANDWKALYSRLALDVGVYKRKSE
jgi:predicted DNA-binding WGR domain protein